ncbi:PaaI family thioesterase [Deferribacter autotrophicus]|uniref:PaaI family thioesterase n=1 Tax=Deferribacter autotrophicus TaxID=500465 RepID=A0A5A8F864_9BACT|nr:hotdog fold domain-containing protein [Deferribacter autotrophicus]KAA0258218.1 PaaI family thioesterase [Deferribacter autotrophicus]
MNKIKYLPHSTKCFVCGRKNPVSLKHLFYVEDDFVCSDIFIPDGYNGFKGIVHGGIATALLDETMGWCAYVFGNGKNLYFTRKLQIKFKKSLYIEHSYKVVTNFTDEKKGIVTVKGKIIDKNENILVEGEGYFVEIPDNKMKETIQYLLFDKDKIYLEKIVNRIKELQVEDSQQRK